MVTLDARRAWVLVAIVSTTAAGCGGGSGTTCRFNSDCPSGRYCAAGACRADCASDAECVTMLGEGALCSSFGMCIAGMDAGAMPDAFVPPPDAFVSPDTSTIDAFTPPDAFVPPETCTPSVVGAVVSDEDGDGSVDEGCPWYFGRPHAVPAVQVHPGLTAPVGISPDGLRLYVTAGPTSVWMPPPPTCSPPNWNLVGDRCVPSCGNAGGDTCNAPTTCSGYLNLTAYDCSVCCNVSPGQPAPRIDRALFVATRTALDQPFGDPVPVAGLETANAITGATFSADELEIIFDEDSRGPQSDLWHATRATRADPFGAIAPIVELNSATDRDFAPRLSVDGLEIWFTRLVAATGHRSTWHARRASTGATFSTPERVTFDPTLLEEVGAVTTPDGLTAFFSGNNGTEWRVYRTERASRDVITFSTPVEVTELFGSYTVIDLPALAQREVWLLSNRPWTPGEYGVFRAQICRDGPCVEPMIACPTGVRSPDGNHCYFDRPDMLGRDDAARACAAAGAHLPTFHSDAESSLVATRFPGYWWTGGSDEMFENGWRWDWPERVGPAEPWIYAQWGQAAGFPREPIGGQAHDCAVWVTGWPSPGLNDAPCGDPASVVCEDDVWPTW